MTAPKRKSLPSSFAAMGAKEYEAPTMKRIIMTLDGTHNTGKTEIALQAPDPVAYFSLDQGLDGVINKYLKKKAIGVFQYDLPAKKDQALYINVWNSFFASYYAAVENPDVRTIVLDKGGDVWDLLRMAILGAFEKIPSLKYTEVNGMYRQLFRAVKSTNKNLIVTHEIEKEYQNVKKDGKDVSEWTGGYKRDGFNKLGFLLDASITTRREGKEFTAEIVEAKRNMNVAGDVLEGDECSFAGIVEAVFGEPMDPEEWGM